VAARLVGEEGGAMPGQNSEEAVGARGCVGGRWGCRWTVRCCELCAVRRVGEGREPQGIKTDFFLADKG
jgi:hypothetical protein